MFLLLREADGSEVIFSTSKIIKVKPEGAKQSKIFLVHGDPVVVDMPMSDMCCLLESCKDQDDGLKRLI